MSQKRPTPSPLLEAAAAFDEEIASYTHLSEAFLRAPLTSAKHLERVNDTLTKITEAEARLGVAGKRLAEALNGARDEQQRLAQATIERIGKVKERTAQLQALLGQFDALAGEAASINQAAVAISRGQADAATAPGELATRMQALAARAQEVTANARQADFEELANQGHALHQQLHAAAKKLAMAGVR